MNIKGWIFPDSFISPQQNTRFAWIALQPCMAFFFVIFTCMTFVILLTIKWMKRPKKKKKKNPAKAIWWWASGGTSSGCRGCCSCHCGVKSFAVEHCDLWPFHSALSACWSARHVEHCELNNVSFPLNGVVVNIYPSLILLASSEGNRLDRTCAKNNKEREKKVALDRWVLCLSQWKKIKFVCLLLLHFSGKQKKG